MSADLSARSKRYKELLSEAATYLGASVTDTAVERLAFNKSQREDLVARALEGERVDTAEVQRLDEAIAAVRPPEKPVEVVIKFVPPSDAAKPGEGSVDGLQACRRCHWSPLLGDYVTRCYKCGWYDGADDYYLPFKSPFADSTDDAATPSASAASGDAQLTTASRDDSAATPNKPVPEQPKKAVQKADVGNVSTWMGGFSGVSAVPGGRWPNPTR